MVDYKDILESIEFPVVVISKDKKIHYINSSAKELKIFLGFPKFFELITYPLSLKLVKEGFSVKGILKEINNSKYMLDISTISGTDLKTILIKDVTRFLELEEKIKREGSIVTVSKLLYEIFHEMKGPVGGIKAFAQLLKEDPLDKELIDDILEQTDRLENIINEITFLSKDLILNKKPINIHQIIRKTVNLFRKQYKDIEFKEIFDPSLPNIAVDKELLVRVLTNIIRNAIEAINFKGWVEIRTGISWDKVYSPKGDKISIQIKDSGKGVPKELEDKLFYPLISTKKNGMGLGLSISYKIIKQHNGILKYIGNSTFEILLPIKDK
ncbi:two-component system sensor histidine kinase NtrB [Hydrogenothermus marinus]|uniref:histidine kinase n=1 Tax=Hydrogenothermus marinus TaxID=133270 RepID=A0A3M0BN12_9AQUI|nr:ATP-binding protein [Hydrogenothermus marinus]RMA92502.1 two-component system nitrogen regulation sensor histidine kinase GlnL [Hydrogenothermus marinus]